MQHRCQAETCLKSNGARPQVAINSHLEAMFDAIPRLRIPENGGQLLSSANVDWCRRADTLYLDGFGQGMDLNRRVRSSCGRVF